MRILSDILGYCFRGSGKHFAIWVVIMLIAVKFAVFVPFGFIVYFLVHGYLAAVWFQLIRSSATGAEEAPMFPESSNIFEDLLWPLIQLLFAIFICFLPAILYAALASDGPDPTIETLLIIGGLIYFPMAVLAMVVLGRVSAIGPHIVVPAILRTGGLYVITLLLLGLLVVVKLFVEEWLLSLAVETSGLRGALLAWIFIEPILFVYLYMASARALGVLYREREEELAWL